MAEFDFYYPVRAGREYLLRNVTSAPVDFILLRDKENMITVPRSR
ncbi:hypothetical protein [Pyrococcus kukulkanii]|nr:hypothetical protein [Pyrococcus kukulkanii]